MRPSSTTSVLVVEAHADMRTAIQMVLEFERYAVTTVRSVRDALTELQWTGRPDLLLLDETLPELERARLIRFIRQEPMLGSLPIVLLSGRDTLRPPNVQAVLRKPFTLDELCAVVQAHGEAREVSRTRMQAVHPQPPVPAAEDRASVRMPGAFPG